MKRVRIELAEVAAFPNLVAALAKAARGKRCRPQVQRFLADTHGKILVFDLAKATDHSLDLQIIRRVRDHAVEHSITKDDLVTGRIKGVTAEQPMLSQLPEITIPGHWRPRPRRDILIEIRREPRWIENEVDRTRIKSAQCEIEIG